jgi:hypothetical protein
MSLETVYGLRRIDKSLLPLINISEKNIIDGGVWKRAILTRETTKKIGIEREKGKEMIERKRMGILKENIEDRLVLEKELMRREMGTQKGERIEGGGNGVENEGEEEKVKKIVDEEWKEAELIMEKVKRFEFVVKGGNKKLLEQIFVSVDILIFFENYIYL